MPPRKVYISFLGTSNYQETEYLWVHGNEFYCTPYGQEAELYLAKEKDNYIPDVVYILVTEISEKAHWDEWKGYDSHNKRYLPSKGLGLYPRIQTLLPNTNIKPIRIPDGLTELEQWKIFEILLEHIQEQDHLILDITHGYRVTPVVLSSALHFLRLVRNIEVHHVYYASYETLDKRIIDYVGFYEIQYLTNAIARLNDEADIRSLLQIRKQKRRSNLDLSLLHNDELLKQLKKITDAFRNIESHFIGIHAKNAMASIQQKLHKIQNRRNSIPYLLLDRIHSKFAILSYDDDTAQNRYFSENYFQVQLDCIKMLVKHQLCMQAYTLFREYIGSLGMIFVDNANWKNRDGRLQRRTQGEVFLHMIQFAEKFTENERNREAYHILLPAYQKIQVAGIAQTLQQALNNKEKPFGINHFRTAFAHACSKQEHIPAGWEDAINHWLPIVEEATKTLWQIQATQKQHQ